jgi:signal transduction histidine kinase
LGLFKEKRTWNWLDTFLFVVRTSWVTFNSFGIIPIYTSHTARWLLVLWFVSLYIGPYLFYRPGFINFRYYLAAEFLLTGGMFLFLVTQFSEAGPGLFDIMIFPLLTIAYVSQSRPLVWLTPMCSLLLLAAGLTIGHFWTNVSVLSRFADIFIFYGFGFALGKVTEMNNKKKELIESIQVKNQTLEQYAKRIEELTIIEERNRVSQDLHDTVGHIFTSVITSLDALPFLMKSNKEEAESYIKEISVLARKGLDDVRNTIHQLSPIEDVQTLSDSFKIITEDFIKHTGTKVDLKIQGSEREIGERIKYTFIRCLQESLTNAKRHGQASHIKIILQFSAETTLFEIKDNGTGSKNITPGFGLSSMNDRVLSIGGTLQVQSELNKGTKITCSIPLPKEELIVI